MSALSRAGISRPVEEWKSALMTLPENSFFELLRSVLGNIKTPFNKQKLLEDLFALLSRNEIRKVIAAYIDENDHKVIAAVALLNEPTPGELESFFAGDFGSGELHSLLINLEERLILYRVRDEGIPRLSLNPVLEKILEPFVKDTEVLFPGFPNKGTAEMSTPARVSGAVTTAVLTAFLLGGEELFRADGGTEFRETGFRGIPFSGFRKKVLDEAKNIFPELDIETAVGTFLRLGLFRVEGQGLTSNSERVKDFGSLSPLERQEYWTAGVYLCLHEAAAGKTPETGTAEQRFSGFQSSFRSFRNQIKGLAGFIHGFGSAIKAETLYPETTLRRFVKLLEKTEGGTVWGSALFESRVKLDFDLFLSAMEKTGFLEKVSGCSGESLWKAGVPSETAEKDISAEKPVIAMTAAFSFILYPEISFSDAFMLGEFCSAKDGNTVHLTRESAVRGFDSGIKASAMLALLEKLSLNRLDPNIDWTLKDWENRYAGVTLNRGVVLTLADDRRYLAEAGPVSSLIRETLAPGVYLLSCGETAEVAAALQKAGIDIIARPNRAGDAGKGPDPGGRMNWFSRLGGSAPGVFLPLSSSGGSEQNPEPADGTAAPESSGAETIKEKFRAVLEKMRLSKQERDELSARIERRLVLSEAQLEGTSLRYEKLEARGLDYAGKSIIARQAFESGSLLEVHWPGQGGSNHCTGIPRALEKKDGEIILVIMTADKTVEAPEDTIRVPLGKISLIRRIKQSIFGE